MIKLLIKRDDFWHRQYEIVDWCNINICDYEYKIPEEDKRWSYSSIFGNGLFKFKYENDAMLFKLTWSADGNISAYIF
jgi:hypothetical protein